MTERIADVVAGRYEDGQTWESKTGVRLEDVLTQKATETKYEGFSIHRFEDGSGIVTFEWGSWSTLEEALDQGLEIPVGETDSPLRWTLENAGSDRERHTASHNGNTLEVYQDAGVWCWRVTRPDGYQEGDVAASGKGDPLNTMNRSMTEARGASDA